MVEVVMTAIKMIAMVVVAVKLLMALISMIAVVVVVVVAVMAVFPFPYYFSFLTINFYINFRIRIIFFSLFLLLFKTSYHNIYSEQSYLSFPLPRF